MSGRFNEAIAFYEKYLPQLGYPENKQKLEWVCFYGKTGRETEARNLLAEVASSSDKSIPPTEFTLAYQALGEVEKMFEFLELAFLQPPHCQSRFNGEGKTYQWNERVDDFQR